MAPPRKYPKTFVCEKCGIEFYSKGRAKRRFCSVECYNSSGEARRQWEGMAPLAWISNTKHGESRTSKKAQPEWRTWNAMRNRCNNPSAGNWKYYGARGVKICERWDSYETFLIDMGRKPSPAHSIDRIDPRGHYEPSNCRWATAAEQAANRRKNVRPWRLHRTAGMLAGLI